MGWRGYAKMQTLQRPLDYIKEKGKDTGFLHSFGLVHILDCGMILMVYLHPNHAPPVNGAWKAEGAGRKDASGVQP